MNNHLYNLMNQTIQEQKSLWRIERNYADESQSDNEKAFWEKMKADKKSHVEELIGLIEQELM